MTAVPTLPLLRGQLGLDEALEDDDNTLVKLRYPAQKRQFLVTVASRKDSIEAMVRHQLNTDWCQLCPMETWRSGSFNLAIPVLLPSNEIVYLRLPLPYRVGEGEAPGNADEKLRTEVATYIWMEENCPDVPTPTLLAFGLPDGHTFSHPSNTPFIRRQMWEVRRWFSSLLGRPIPMRHVWRGQCNPLESGYLILSQAKGTRLALSWDEHKHDKSYRDRLFRSLARISVSMNRRPLPRIGSWTFHSNGGISLTNRPLDWQFQMLENEGIPSGIPRDRTYACIEPYLSDLLSLQDNKILHQPNAIQNERDGRGQLAALAALRATMHKFIRPQCRDGPFFLTLTYLERQNIFVDDDWNVQTIIDLEWVHSRPVEMQLPPYWLTSRDVDSFEEAAAVAEYDSVLNEYLDVYEAEEMRRNGVAIHAPVQRQAWSNGSFWYFNAVSIPKAMFNIFGSHVQPLFNKEHPKLTIFDDVFFWYWGSGASDTIQAKLNDKQRYLQQVRRAFGHTAAESSGAQANGDTKSDEPDSGEAVARV